MRSFSHAPRGFGAAVLLALMALLALAGCGAGDDGGAELTVIDDDPVTTPLEPAGDFAERLPDTAAIPGLEPAEARALRSVGEVAALSFAEGEVLFDEAARRLRREGLRQAVARQQLGVDPSEGLSALRTFVLRFRSTLDAQDEVDGLADQIETVENLQVEQSSVDEVIGSRVLRTQSTRPGGASASVLILFARGAHVYGVQGFAPRAAQIPEGDLTDLARRHAEAEGS